MKETYCEFTVRMAALDILEEASGRVRSRLRDVRKNPDDFFNFERESNRGEMMWPANGMVGQDWEKLLLEDFRLVSLEIGLLRFPLREESHEH